MAVPIIGALLKLVGKLLGFAAKFNLGGKIHDLVVEAEKLAKMTGAEKLAYVVDKVSKQKEVKKRFAAIKAGAVKLGLDADKLVNTAYAAIKAQVEAEVDALNALGALLPHKTQPVAKTAYAVTVNEKDIDRLGGSV